MTSSTSRSVSPYAPRCRSSRTIGRIAPRYCTTSRLPTLSTASVRTCSRRGSGEPDDGQARPGVLPALGVAAPPPGLGAPLPGGGDGAGGVGPPPPPADRGQQHPLPFGLGSGGLGSGLPGLLALRGLGTQCPAGQRLDVEDEGYRTVAQDGRARVQADRLSWPPTALTTISSVLITRSTTSPKRRPSERRTAMTTWPSCRSDGRPSTSVSRTSGSSPPRSR